MPLAKECCIRFLHFMLSLAFLFGGLFLSMNLQCSPTSLKRSTESRNDLKPFTDSNTGRAFGLKYSKIGIYL
ncbi:Uncharacterized protein HZ326_0120 [Fusarium oxysporum f. sp. albedinis]|nr:Uncharacterized protein HZ326_0120 [Fusarium oxysporum f. sp. albedinis]